MFEIWTLNRCDNKIYLHELLKFNRVTPLVSCKATLMVRAKHTPIPEIKCWIYHYLFFNNTCIFNSQTFKRQNIHNLCHYFLTFTANFECKHLLNEPENLVENRQISSLKCIPETCHLSPLLLKLWKLFINDLKTGL